MRILRHIVTTALACLALHGGAVLAQPLEQELLRLLAEHPQIRAQQASVESARQGEERAFSGYLPRVDATGNIGPASTQTEQRRDAGIDAFQEVQQVAGVTLTQNVFNGYRTPTEVRIARLTTEVATQTLEGTRQSVLLAGVNAYLDVLRQKTLVDLAKLSEDSIKLQASLEDERVQRGAGITVDVLQAKARLQIAKERRVAFEGALENAITRYVQVFNRTPNVDGLVDPLPPVERLPESLNQAIDIARQENPAVTGSLATVDVAAERRTLARSGYFPVLDVIGSANYEKNFDLQPGERVDFSLIVQATWNLFNGFATRAGVSQAAYDYSAAQDNHDFVLRTVVESTRFAWQQLVTARQRVELLENAVNIAAEVFDARRGLREAGKETVIDVLIAEDELNNARIALTGAAYDATGAVYQLLQTMGRLNATTLSLR